MSRAPGGAVGAEPLHDLDVSYRGKAGVLDERRNARVRHLHQFGDGIARALWHYQPAKPPARHHPRFGETVTDDHPVVRVRDIKQRRSSRRAVVDQARVNLVRDQPNAAPARDIQQRRQLVARRGPAGGIVRAVQDEGARALQHRLQPIEVHAKAAFGPRGQSELIHVCTAQSGGVADIWPGRAVQHHTLAGANRRSQGDGHRGHAGGGDLDAFLCHRTGVQLREIVGQGGPQLRQAAHVGIAGGSGIECGRYGGVRGRGARLVGFAEAEQVDVGRGEGNAGDLEDAGARDADDVHALELDASHSAVTLHTLA